MLKTVRKIPSVLPLALVPKTSAMFGAITFAHDIPSGRQRVANMNKEAVIRSVW